MRASPKFAAGLHNAELRKNVRRNHHKSTVIRYSTSDYPVGGQSAVALDFPAEKAAAECYTTFYLPPATRLRGWRLIRENWITALG